VLFRAGAGCWQVAQQYSVSAHENKEIHFKTVM